MALVFTASRHVLEPPHAKISQVTGGLLQGFGKVVMTSFGWMVAHKCTFNGLKFDCLKSAITGAVHFGKVLCVLVVEV